MYARVGRKGGYVPKCTVSYLRGGRVKNVDFFCLCDYLMARNQKRLKNKLGKLIKTRSSHRRCSIEKVFLKISQIHRKTSVLKGLLIKLQDPGLKFCKKQTLHKSFPVNFSKILRTQFLQNTSGRLLLKNFSFNSMMLLIDYLIRRTIIHCRCITSDPVYQKDCKRHFIFSVRSVKSILSVALFADIG